MKIRLGGTNVTLDQAVNYRRKAPSQVNRDKTRAEKYRSAVSVKSPPATLVAKSHDPQRQTGVRTRQMIMSEQSMISDVETVRCDQKTESSPDDVFILSLDTPEIGIQGSSSSLLDMTDLCPTASPFVPSLKAV